MEQIIQRVSKQISAYEQVEDHLRAQIKNGTWPIGSKLPNSKLIAQKLGTSLSTVQTAMEHLCREGLVERKPKSGTHVRSTKAKLTGVGIYVGCDFWKDPENGFLRMICTELQRKCAERGVQAQMFIDDRLPDEQSTPFKPLMVALRKWEIQAIVGSGVKSQNHPWLTKLRVPMAFSTNLQIPGQVAFDFDRMWRESLEHLRNQGCRKIGLISSSFGIGSGNSSGIKDDADRFYDAFFDAIRHFGLQTRNKWVRVPGGDVGMSREEFGYRQFEELWKQSEKPDGLLVYPDFAVRGVLTGILTRRVAVPRELKLVLHRNDCLPYSCSVPATWMLSKAADFADAMIAKVCRELDRQPSLRVLVPLSIEPNGIG